jgi:hypothetical protein
MKEHFTEEFESSYVALNVLCSKIEKVVGVLLDLQLTGWTYCIVQFPPNNVTACILSAIDVLEAARGNEIGGWRCIWSDNRR